MDRRAPDGGGAIVVCGHSQRGYKAHQHAEHVHSFELDVEGAKLLPLFEKAGTFATYVGSEHLVAFDGDSAAGFRLGPIGAKPTPVPDSKLPQPCLLVSFFRGGEIALVHGGWSRLALFRCHDGKVTLVCKPYDGTNDQELKVPKDVLEKWKSTGFEGFQSWHEVDGRMFLSDGKSCFELDAG